MKQLYKYLVITALLLLFFSLGFSQSIQDTSFFFGPKLKDNILDLNKRGLLLEKHNFTESQYVKFMQACDELFIADKSKYHSDSLSFELIRSFLNREDIDELYKIRYRFILKNLSLNKVGSIANNFEFSYVSGERDSLYCIGSEIVILIFASEGCPNCQRLKTRLNSRFLRELVSSGKVAILYLSDHRDFEKWQQTYNNHSHINYIFDHNRVVTNLNFDYNNSSSYLYYVQNLPVIYVLDSDKKVLLRGVSYQFLEKFLAKKFGIKK